MNKRYWPLALIALWSIWFLLDPFGYVASWNEFQSQCRASRPHSFGDYAFNVAPCGTWVRIALAHLGVMLLAIFVSIVTSSRRS